MEKKSFEGLLLIITMFLGAIFILITINDMKKDELDKTDARLVTDVSDFYTIESCVNKYVSYLMSKDYKAIYNLLDDNYINKNNISENNLDKYIDFYDKYYSFQTEDIYQYKTMNIYYVKGKLIEDVMDISNPKEKKFKITIKLDKENSKFSIIPDGDGGVIYD